ncbi:sialidase family protein [Microlunatus parietis]|uniref:Sialidase domain-containing protein n=1 Tax=Microlunatus parietis TaxID=682979 RepID=A0A7Y9I5X7_9ACTN|nr:sialidase family protein [Microlunatus parietis]NYE70886.1 hypothetical protein [Microlunatus parietis]
MPLPRRTLLTSIAVGATTVALGTRAAQAQPSTASGTGTRTDPVIVASAPSGRMAFFPDMIKLADGRLLVGYRDSVSHIAQDGRILVVESSDDGRTWSTPRVAVDTAIDDRDPKLVQLRDGTILMNFFRTDWTGYPRNPATLVGTFVVRSTDGGATWSEPVQVGTAMSGPSKVIVGAYYAGHAATHGPILELPDGDLLVPLYGRLPEGGSGPATVVRSTDGGLTWPKEGEAFIGQTAGLDYQEPNLSILRDGTLLSILRTSRNIAYLSWSDDGGRSWSTPVDSGFPASSHHQLSLPGGSILFTYGDPSRKINTGRPTLGRILRHPERGIGDEKEILIYDAAIHGAPTFDQANPSSVAFTPDRYFTVTSDPYLKSIVGVYTDVTEYVGRP